MEEKKAVNEKFLQLQQRKLPQVFEKRNQLIVKSLLVVLRQLNLLLI